MNSHYFFFAIITIDILHPEIRAFCQEFDFIIALEMISERKNQCLENMNYSTTATFIDKITEVKKNLEGREC